MKPIKTFTQSNKEETLYFTEIEQGNYFYYAGTVFVKTHNNYATNLNTGVLQHFSQDIPVIVTPIKEITITYKL